MDGPIRPTASSSRSLSKFHCSFKRKPEAQAPPHHSPGTATMATCFRALPINYSIPYSTTNFQSLNRRNLRINSSSIGARNSAKVPMPPINPKDPFLSKLASLAANSPEKLLERPVSSDTPPYLDLFDSPQLMASPAQVCFSHHTLQVD